MIKTKPKKRGRKLGVKIGPIGPRKVLNLRELYNELKELQKIVAKHEKALS